MPEKNVQVNTDRGLPYERFLQFGPENLTEAELLAVILRTGTKEDSAVALAEKVLALATYPREGLLGLHDVSVEELMEIRGIGMVKAVKLKCIAELSNRMSRAKARERPCEKMCISNSRHLKIICFRKISDPAECDFSTRSDLLL